MVLIMSIFACKQEKDEEVAKLNKLQQELELQPSEERARTYLKEINSFVSLHYSEDQKVKPYLMEGADVAIKYGFLDQTPTFLLPLLRRDLLPEQRKKYLMELGDIMININKTHASNVIYKELAKTDPNDPEIVRRRSLIDSTALATEDYVKFLFDQMLVNPDEMGINKAAAMKFVDAAEAFALAAPNDPKAADYLYKGAEVARSMRTMPKAMSIYDWILEDYPTYEKTPTVMFIKGFIMEQDFKKIEEAKALYTQFLERFPEHQMASSAKFLLDNLGKSEEDILKDIESKNKK
jgi:tetratricopeptide (TPR) repeat protein